MPAVRQLLTDPDLLSVSQLTAETKPIVRDRTFKCLFEWLKTPPAEAALAEHYDQVEAVLVAGLTDVWSAIRKACAARLLGLEHNLKHPHMMQLYESCVTICQRAENGPNARDAVTWQAREGALMVRFLTDFDLFSTGFVQFPTGSVLSPTDFVRFSTDFGLFSNDRASPRSSGGSAPRYATRATPSRRGSSRTAALPLAAHSTQTPCSLSKGTSSAQQRSRLRSSARWQWLGSRASLTRSSQ